jgi:hypothetical protein
MQPLAKRLRSELPKKQDNIATFVETRKKHFDETTVCMICVELMSASSTQKIGNLKSGLHYSNVDMKIICEGSTTICNSCVAKTNMCPCCRLFWSKEDLECHEKEVRRRSDELSRRHIRETIPAALRMVVHVGGDLLRVPLEDMIQYAMTTFARRSSEERREQVRLASDGSHRLAHIPILPEDQHGKKRFMDFMNLLGIQAEFDRINNVGIAIVIVAVSEMLETVYSSTVSDYNQYFIRWYNTGRCACRACRRHMELCSNVLHILGSIPDCVFYKCVWGINPTSKTLILTIEK